jgi:thioredoxin 1
MKTIKYFTATWCGPCKAFKPVMNEVAGEGHSVEFIDVDEQQNIAVQYGVRSIPTVVIEENGNEVDRFIGALPKQTILEKVS